MIPAKSNPWGQRWLCAFCVAHSICAIFLSPWPHCVKLPSPLVPPPKQLSAWRFPDLIRHSTSRAFRTVWKMQVARGWLPLPLVGSSPDTTPRWWISSPRICQGVSLLWDLCCPSNSNCTESFASLRGMGMGKILGKDYRLPQVHSGTNLGK